MDLSDDLNDFNNDTDKDHVDKEFICPNCSKPIYDDEALLCLYCGEPLGKKIGIMQKFASLGTNIVVFGLILFALLCFLIVVVL